jgi:hypothetical protein
MGPSKRTFIKIGSKKIRIREHMIVALDGRSRCIGCSTLSKHKKFCRFTKSATSSPSSISTSNLNNDTAVQISNAIPDNDPTSETEPILEEKFQHVEMEWKRKLKTLPVFRKWFHTAESKKINQKHDEWPNWSFQVSNSLIHGLNMSNDSLTKIDFSVHPTLMYVICPHIFFPMLMEGISIKCPECESGDHVVMDGWSKGFNIMHDVGVSKFVKSRRYKCNGVLPSLDTCHNSFFSIWSQTL